MVGAVFQNDNVQLTAGHVIDCTAQQRQRESCHIVTGLHDDRNTKAMET